MTTHHLSHDDETDINLAHKSVRPRMYLTIWMMVMYNGIVRVCDMTIWTMIYRYGEGVELQVDAVHTNDSVGLRTVWVVRAGQSASGDRNEGGPSTTLRPVLLIVPPNHRRTHRTRLVHRHTVVLPTSLSPSLCCRLQGVVLVHVLVTNHCCIFLVCRVVSCRVVSCRVVSCRVVSCRGHRQTRSAWAGVGIGGSRGEVLGL